MTDEFAINILEQYRENPTLINEIETAEEAVWLDEALDMAIKALEQTRWIPVSERLPEEGEPILLSTKTGEVYEGAYFDLCDNRQWYVYRDENYAWNNVVTAWQPLPESYRGDKDGNINNKE
jgi:hypothetical protein